MHMKMSIMILYNPNLHIDMLFQQMFSCLFQVSVDNPNPQLKKPRPQSNLKP